jgi:hypothetical protein
MRFGARNYFEKNVFVGVGVNCSEEGGFFTGAAIISRKIPCKFQPSEINNARQ